MPYIVFKTPLQFHQVSIDEFLFGADDCHFEDGLIKKDYTSTRTFVVSSTWPYRFALNIDGIVDTLESFNNAYEHLRQVDRHTLYREFHIPKKSGGLRKIDAPNDELMGALRLLKNIIETKCVGQNLVFGKKVQNIALYHTAAFAYIKNRCTLDAIRKHQQNDSRWFAKFDLSNFFGSTTLEYTIQMLKQIYPFCEIMRSMRGEMEFTKAIELAFLDGGLPQGTPISPLITNIIMIPIDYELSSKFRKFSRMNKDGERQEIKCVYTRYADDFCVSSEYDFSFMEAQQLIIDTLAEHNAPFTIKKEKTRYGSRAGSNWNLGLMLGNDGRITIGYKNKKQIKAMLSSYAMDKKNGINWSLEDVQVMEGKRNYYHMVEPDDADNVLKYLSDRHGIDIVASIKRDLKG